MFVPLWNPDLWFQTCIWANHCLPNVLDREQPIENHGLSTWRLRILEIGSRHWCHPKKIVCLLNASSWGPTLHLPIFDGEFRAKTPKDVQGRPRPPKLLMFAVAGPSSIASWTGDTTSVTACVTRTESSPVYSQKKEKENIVLKSWEKKKKKKHRVLIRVMAKVLHAQFVALVHQFVLDYEGLAYSDHILCPRSGKKKYCLSRKAS